MRNCGKFYAPDPSSKRFLPVSDPAQVEVLENGLDRWRQAKASLDAAEEREAS